MSSVPLELTLKEFEPKDTYFGVESKHPYEEPAITRPIKRCLF